MKNKRKKTANSLIKWSEFSKVITRNEFNHENQWLLFILGIPSNVFFLASAVNNNLNFTNFTLFRVYIPLLVHPTVVFPSSSLSRQQIKVNVFPVTILKMAVFKFELYAYFASIFYYRQVFFSFPFLRNKWMSVLTWVSISLDNISNISMVYHFTFNFGCF